MMIVMKSSIIIDGMRGGAKTGKGGGGGQHGAGDAVTGFFPLISMLSTHPFIVVRHIIYTQS